MNRLNLLLAVLAVVVIGICVVRNLSSKDDYGIRRGSGTRPALGDYLITEGSGGYSKYAHQYNPGIGGLCRECIGHCHLKLWSGVNKLQKGESEKNRCVKSCSLECDSPGQLSY